MPASPPPRTPTRPRASPVRAGPRGSPTRARRTAAQATAADRWLPGVDFSGLATIERVLVRAPVRLLRARNSVLDVLFYDVDTLPPAVRHRLLRWSDPDGSIVVVCPGDARHREVHHFEHVEDFVASAWSGIDVIAIAGVGSSAIGTAALAANVADARGRPVAGIVSGYGLVDAIAEGLTGWFVLRAASQLRQIGAWLSAFAVPLLSRISADTQPNGDPWRLVSYVRGLPESETLDWLLARADVRPALLVGHSKGNLSLATALAQLPPDLARTLCPALGVVTFGALVPLPASLAATRQYLGALDLFGLVNSLVWPAPRDVVPDATHTTNARLPLSLRVRELLQPPTGARRAAPAPPLPIQLGTAAAIAFQAAMSESVRSLMQGVAQVRRRSRSRAAPPA